MYVGCSSNKSISENGREINVNEFTSIFFHLKMGLGNLTLVIQITGNHERPIELFCTCALKKSIVG